MKQLTAQHKHSILTHYSSRSSGESADSIAATHQVKGGRQTLLRWLAQWDGTP
jgi:hypothetical protein